MHAGQKTSFLRQSPQYCDLRLYPRLRYISSARQVHLREENMRRMLAILLAVAGSALLGVPAAAETMMFKAPLSANEEVPPNQSKGTGNIEATCDTSSKKLSWKGSYSG